MTKEEFILECKKINIEITDQIINNLEKYKDLLIKWNQKFNLTTIIEEKDIYLKHFFDSIYLSKFADLNNKKICDFGTGAGFPGLVLAIVYNSCDVTLLESNNKKVLFLNEVKNILKLNNVEIINERAEIYSKNNREIFDIVTCRAVSALNIILELSIGMLKIDGLFLPMKSNIDKELEESEKICNLLGYSLIKINEYLLPIENSKRTVLIYKKIKKTDSKFPRNYNIIKRSCVK